MIYGFFYNSVILMPALGSLIQVFLKVGCYRSGKMYRCFRVLFMQRYQVSLYQQLFKSVCNDAFYK
jgi:hypothetical protein